MGVSVLKKLMKDIQEVCEIGGTHMKIAMPGLLTTHSVKHKQIKDALDSTDANVVSKYVRGMEDKAKLRADDVKNLRKEAGELADSLPGRNTVREALDSLKNQHADIEARRRSGEKDVPLSDVEKLANQYAKRVLSHYSNPADKLGMAKTAAKAALSEIQATIGENVAPELRNAAIEHIFNETVSGTVTVNGHNVTLQEFKDYIDDVKK